MDAAPPRIETSRQDWRFGLLVLAAALFSLWPALLNRAPLIHPDTLGYFRAGEHTLQAAASLLHLAPHAAGGGHGLGLDTRGERFGAERSVYYGAFFVALFRLGGVWLAAFVQGLITALVAAIAARRFGAGDPGRLAAALGALMLVSGAAAFSSALMPDLFAGLMLLAAAVLIGAGAALSRPERLFLFAVVLMALVSHATCLLLLASVVLAMAGWRWLIGRRPERIFVLLAGLIILGLAADAAVSLAVEKLLHAPNVARPFLLARLEADGPAVDYLKGHCGPKPFALCRYLDRMPEPANDFLWSHEPAKAVIASASLTEQQRIDAETPAIIRGTLQAYPLRQLAISAGNAARQFASVGVSDFNETDAGKLAGIAPTSAFYPAAARYIAERRPSDAGRLDGLSQAMSVAYGLALLGLAGWAGPRLKAAEGSPRQRLAVFDTPFATAAVTILVGVIANAVICGALSGVFDRYQGRVAWTVTFLATLALVRRHTAPHV